MRRKGGSGTYRDFGFFVDLALARAVFVGAEDLQGLLAREREARREVAYVASAIVFVDDELNPPHRTPRPWKAFECVEGKMSTYRR